MEDNCPEDLATAIHINDYRRDSKLTHGSVPVEASGSTCDASGCGEDRTRAGAATNRDIKRPHTRTSPLMSILALFQTIASDEIGLTVCSPRFVMIVPSDPRLSDYQLTNRARRGY